MNMKRKCAQLVSTILDKMFFSLHLKDQMIGAHSCLELQVPLFLTALLRQHLKILRMAFEIQVNFY